MCKCKPVKIGSVTPFTYHVLYYVLSKNRYCCWRCISGHPVFFGRGCEAMNIYDYCSVISKSQCNHSHCTQKPDVSGFIMVILPVKGLSSTQLHLSSFISPLLLFDFLSSSVANSFYIVALFVSLGVLWGSLSDCGAQAVIRKGLDPSLHAQPVAYWKRLYGLHCVLMNLGI